MIVFQVSLNFCPMKEIPKIQCRIYILMKRVIILSKIQAAMKAFTILQTFQFGLEQKKTCYNESHEKETTEAVVYRYSSKQMFLGKHRKAPVLDSLFNKVVVIQVLIYYILEQQISAGANADIAKTKRKKQIVFVVERWMQCLLLRLKSRSTREASFHAAFMGNCQTVSHTCQLYLPSR